MILGFKTCWKDGTPTNFPDKILAGIKQTTIREDRGERYKVGTKLHFATGVRTKKYNQFAEGIIESISLIQIDPEKREVSIRITPFTNESHTYKEDSEAFNTLVKSEGFASKNSFWRWFNKPISGKLIHWRLFK